MKYVYLDWNVFNKIGGLNSIPEDEQPTFSFINKLIENKQIICPYSNAHINDLLRGHAKNPTYIPKHLQTLKDLTRDFCITQYWGNENVTWHYRDISEFFNSAVSEDLNSSKSFADLLTFDHSGIMKATFDSLKLIPTPPNFEKAYEADPIFRLMFPRAKAQMNMFAMCEDIYDFSLQCKKDYSLYKSLRNFFNQNKVHLKDHLPIIDNVDQMTSKPFHLSDQLWDAQSGKTKTSANETYQTITNTYCKIDFRGYKSDERFSNMIDDSLHVFYGAHCDYFVTNDDRCHYKAIETYKQLNIKTVAVKPKEFVEEF